METITFYSYKGGTGRSLALANAAVYLAKLGFKVVALDFDLEAPGLHYKLSPNQDGTPLKVEKGVVDYVISFLVDGDVQLPLRDFIVSAVVPGIDKPLVHLLPAGRAPSIDYWSKLSRIDWHDLFYKKGAKGVQIFKELQTRILDELQPDFLLIDSRTGITEMGGVATTILADKVLCLVLPTLENLEGARAVLRSLKRSRRESKGTELEIMVAVSRLPEVKGSEDEREVTEWILSLMNQPAEDAKDSLYCKNVFVLHSEAALQVQEALRVGSGTNPDESILLRDYLRLFASFVPKQSIEPKVHDLIEKAWEKLRYDPDAAIKEMEELAESFAHPENYRELLRFYRARNADPTLILRRAQRLWEITRDSGDSYLWEVIAKYFEPKPPYHPRDKDWRPDLSFIRAVWRDAGGKDSKLGAKLAEAYSFEDEDSVAADVLHDIMETSGPTPALVARSIFMLDFAKRTDESEALIENFKNAFSADSEFANAWARHALKSRNKVALTEITKSPAIEKLRPATMGQVYFSAGMADRAIPIADSMLRDVRQGDASRREFDEIGKFFSEIDRWDDFEKTVIDKYPREILMELRERLGIRANPLANRQSERHIWNAGRK
jgi:MinD-like ATPase involved in chromosome partitioning or flagellar assembly